MRCAERSCGPSSLCLFRQSFLLLWHKSEHRISWERRSEDDENHGLARCPIFC